MSKIEIKFLGIPHIKINEKKIELPFSKAEAILYFLLYEKLVSREVLSTLLWGDMEEQQSKKNLRNAIYIIRKESLDDIIVSPKRSVLEINNQYRLESDLDTILNFEPTKFKDTEEVDCFLGLYDGVFLETLKNNLSTNYIDWIDRENIKIGNEYIKKLKLLYTELMERKNYKYAEATCRKIILLDEFDEIGYQNLIEVYNLQGQFQKAIEAYIEISEKLDSELAVKPSKEIEDLYISVLKNVNKKSNNVKNKFFGRGKEQDIVYENINKFVSNKSFKSILICGEDGIGKSMFLNKISESLDYNILLIKVSCQEYESGFVFKFWDKVFNEITDIIKENNLNIPNYIIDTIEKSFPTLDLKRDNGQIKKQQPFSYEVTEKAIFDLFKILSQNLKILFLIDDIDNIDSSSRKLLHKTILENKYKIMLIGSSRKIEGEIEEFFSLLKYYDIVEKVYLSRFDLEETRDFIERLDSNLVSVSEKIYNESEGNPLFIVEILNNLTSKDKKYIMSNKIESLIEFRIQTLSLEAKKLVNICSLFQDKFSIDTLIAITDIKKLELTYVIDELLLNDILIERFGKDNVLSFDFTHRKIREYVYKNMSNTKRLILHGKVAEYLEDRILVNMEFNRTLYPDLIYHLEKANNSCKLFKYRIKWLEGILSFTHEIFPVITSNSTNEIGLIEYYIDENFLEKEFENLNKIRNNVSCEKCYNCIEEEIIYLYLYGRFNKNRGNIEQGINSLEEMINLSNERQLTEYSYRGHLQLAHYYLNIMDLENMGLIIKKLEILGDKLDHEFKKATVLRLKGYLYILSGQLNDGEVYIEKALSIFKKSYEKEKYLYSKVACIYYLGEKYRIQGQHKKALNFYYEAIELLEEKEDCPAAAIIFSKIGLVKYISKNIDEAQFYYLKSLKAYEKTIFVWGKADVYYYLFKIYEKKGMLEKAKAYLETSLKYVDKYISQETKKKIYENLK